MRTSTSVFLLAIVFLVSGGCSKNPQTSYSMTAIVGGNAYSASNCVARPSGTTLLIQGLPPNSYLPSYPYISIVLNNWYPQTDTIILDSVSHYAEYITSLTQYKKSIGGALIINTYNSQQMSGRFYFLCSDSTRVDSGAFVARVMP